MTLETILQQVKEKADTIQKIKEEIEVLQKELKKATPYKIGDKVRVTGYADKIYEVYIGDIESYIGWQNKLEWSYKFNKEKKDGTMSGQSAGIYSYNNVELIKRAGE